MPSILSKELAAKILGRDWSFGYNCYEVGHTWTPSCTDAALEVSLAASLKILPLYAMLYTFSQVAVQRKYDLPSSWETSKSILRSSFFIFFHAYNGSLMGCALRHSFGRFYYRVLICAPALISSYLSLLIEKPSRRQALAFYLLNLSSEIVYRMAVTKGYFRPVTYGETLLFASSLASWYYLIKTHGFGHDPVSAVVKVLIGRDEAKSRAKRSSSSSSSSKVALDDGCEIRPQLEATKSNTLNNKLNITKLVEIIDEFAQRWLGAKHASCPHQEPNCFRYVVGPIPSRLLLGYAIQCVLKLSSRPLELFQAPVRTIEGALKSGASLRFGLFLACLVSSGRLTSCLLRRYSGADCSWHGAPAGFVAGLSMAIAPRSSLAMYVMWKAVEQYYLLANKKGKVPYFDLSISTIYSISAATILYTFALEPRFVRPSYMKFLDNLSDHRLHQLNRMVLDVFGTESSHGYEDFFPDLDPRFMSNQFKELIFNWMIQPYE